MRIEVIVDSDDPKIYPLDKPKVVLGSHESCDIIVISESVSRKHLIITSKDDKFFVSDQGSTNGTFLNEQRLIPGNSVEFTSFFPLRIGSNILISLLSDEEAQELGFDSSLNSFGENRSEKLQESRDESTKMISLKDLAKKDTAGLVQKRSQTVAKRKISVAVPEVKKKKDPKNYKVGILGLIIFAAAAYYNFSAVKNKELSEKLAKAEMTKPKQPIKMLVNAGPIKRVDETEIPNPQKIIPLRNIPVCSQEKARELCIAIRPIYQGQWGAVQFNKNLIILADGVKYLSEAKKLVVAPPAIDGFTAQADLVLYKSHLSLVMIVLWAKDNVPEELQNLDSFKDFNITVAFMNPSNKEGEVLAAAAFVPESLVRLRSELQDKYFESAKKEGALAFGHALDYLRMM